MENVETVDQNQLVLFNLLTPEQEKSRLEKIKYFNTICDNQSIENSKKETLLLQNGFIKGIHFENNFSFKYINRDITIDSWDSINKQWVKFNTNIDYKDRTGNIELIFDEYLDGKIQSVTRGFDIASGKIECYSLVDSYRFVKPSTILEKIKLKAEIAINKREYVIKNNSVKNYTLEKYKALYPKAIITLDRESDSYNRGYNRNSYITFDVLKIEFISGSTVTLRITGEKDKEYIWKKFDAVYNKLTKEEIMNKFNEQ
jgi:hypothetical protein